MCYCCKSAAKREDRTERRYTDMRYTDISGYREIGKPRDRETERPKDREIGRARDWEIGRARAEIRRRMESK